MDEVPFDPRRVVTLDGVVNFRDVGGLPVTTGGSMRQGVLFRSDELSRLTRRDQAVLQALQLRLVCDLRTPNEARARPSRLGGLGEVRRVHIPIQPQENDPTNWQMFRYMLRNAHRVDFASDLAGYYHTILFKRTAQIGEVFRLICDPGNLPALIHCTAGKDRTGLVTALVQLVAGASRQAVVADYLLTNHFFKPRVRSFTRSLRWISLFRIPTGQIRHLLEARQEYLEGALVRLFEMYGSVEAYLQEACQVPGKSLEQLQESIIDR